MPELSMRESVTTDELTKQVELIEFCRNEEANYSTQKSAASRRLEEAEQRMIELLNQAQLQSYRCDVGLITIAHRTSVKLPKTPEDLAALKRHLIAEGLEEKLTVGSQWLNGYYKSRVALAQEGKLADPEIPGAKEVTITQTISLRRS